jgi:hypothetical protein
VDPIKLRGLDQMKIARIPLLVMLVVPVAIVIWAVTLFVSTSTQNKGNARANPTPTVLTTTSPTTALSSTDIASLLPNPGFEDGLTGWVLGRVGQDGSAVLDKGYTIDVDQSVKHTGTGSAYIRPSDPDPKNAPQSYGYISTRVPADIFRGKRVRFSAYLRSEDSQAEAGLWMQVPGVIDGTPTDPDIPMSWDDTIPFREVRSTTDWTKIEVVLDIPQQASYILFGMEVGNSGQEWIDDVQLEVVGLNVPTTDRGWLKNIRNLDFEQGLAVWDSGTAQTGKTEIGTGAEMAHTDTLGAYIRHSGGGTQNLGGLSYPGIYGQYYRDKRVRVSMYMNVDKAPKGATLLLWVFYLDANGRRTDAPISDAVDVLPTQSGAKGWQKVQATVDVPDRATALTFGISSNGDGEVWIDDVQIDVLGPAQ